MLGPFSNIGMKRIDAWKLELTLIFVFLYSQQQPEEEACTSDMITRGLIENIR